MATLRGLAGIHEGRRAYLLLMRVEPAVGDRQTVRHRGACFAGFHQPGGPRDHGYRHEPAWGHAATPARAARTSTVIRLDDRAARTKGSRAPAPSNRWLRDALALRANYLVNATDLQIKMAQGSKPGEGGQLPGSQG